VDDQSRRPLPAAAPAGLHNPIFFGFAERGPINTPIKGGGTLLKQVFGDATFETRSKYFQHPNLFARTALGYQDAWFVRLADDTAAKATLVLEAAVSTEDLVQYEKAADGSRLLDGEGDPIPLLEIDGVTPVTEPGIKIVFNTRALGAEETISNLLPTTETVGGATVTTYPLIPYVADSVSSAGNYTGWKLYYTEEYEESAVANIGAMTYRFAPVILDPATNIATPIRDIYAAPFIDIAFKKGAFDASTAMHYSFAEKVRNHYTSTDGNTPFSLLPMDFHVYEDHIDTIVNAILDVSPELVDLEIDPHMINFLSAVDANGNPYDHLLVTNAGEYVHKNRINYLLGGSDGSLTAATLETLTQSYFTADVYPEIGDSARYPITHLYDSGYTLATKQAMIGFLGRRDDVKIELATQDVSQDPNIKAEDQSTGAALRVAVALHPESTFYGTPVCRASIYQQCGRISADPTYTKWVPFTLDRLVKRCMYEASATVRGEPTGLPESAVTLFSEINWAPTADDQKRLNWSTGLNYAQYYDMAALHFPDYRSVYPYDNSVLSSDIFVDHLVYIKHIARIAWATFVGKRKPTAKLYDAMIKFIDGRIHNAFGGTLTSETTVYQTELDAAEGFRHSVRISVRGPFPLRVLDITIPVDRMEG
jgi:hypothetical protein